MTLDELAVSRLAFVALRVCALAALAFGAGCEDGRAIPPILGGPSPEGSGGSRGTVYGSGGSSAPTGIPDAGASGVDGAGGVDVDTLPICPAGVKNLVACMGAEPCANRCGPNQTGLRACTCGPDVPAMTACGRCLFPPNVDTSCYRLPPSPPACPASAIGPELLIKTNDACDEAPCTTCGSAGAGVPSYIDAAGTAKVGFCT